MYIRSTFILSLSFFLIGCMDHMHSTSGQDYSQRNFTSEGERLYFTGSNSKGDAIRPIGGHHHMQMHGGSCVTCHGEDRSGGDIMWPKFWVSAPALNAHALSSTHNDGHAHETYTKQTLIQAIKDGLNPDGEPLDSSMPRWQGHQADLEALADYLLSP
jgi:cytochrome c oxidase subunit 2